MGQDPTAVRLYVHSDRSELHPKKTKRSARLHINGLTHIRLVTRTATLLYVLPFLEDK